MKYTKLLKTIGLTPVQSEIINYLLETNQEKASIIAKKINRPRGVVYNSLDELLKLKLIIKKDASNQVSTFALEHPSKINKIFEQHKEELNQKKEAFESTLPSMISTYNLAHNKPGIEFYEGILGVKRVINDTLTSQTEIYTYTDVEKLNKYIKDINAEYAKKRDQLKIVKKALLVDSPYTKEFLKTYPKTNLNIRFIKDIPYFTTIMQIYDNKISYVTLTDDNMLGVIIQDKHIYEMHKTLFENTWKKAIQP